MLVEDDTGDVELVFFLTNFEWVRQKLPLGAMRWVSGKLEMWDGHLQMVHPDKVMDEAEIARMPLGRAGLWPDRRAVSRAPSRKPRKPALARLPALPEWIDAATLRGFDNLGFAEALRRLHTPSAPGDVEPTSAAARRLAYDELLAGQLALLMVRARHARGCRAGAQVSEGRLAEQRARRAAVPAHRRAGAGDRGDPRRSRRAEAHDPAAARRRRLGQDDRRADRDGACRSRRGGRRR